MPALPRFYVPTARGATVVALPPDEAHHLARVLRLQPGDGVSLFDGVGGEWIGLVLTVAPDVTVEVVDDAETVPEPPVRVTVAAGLLKGPKMDALVRDVTMLGAVSVVPIMTAHVSITRRALRSRMVQQRWQRVALASARQCRRAVVPVVEPISSFEEVLDGATADARLMCVEPACPGAQSTTGLGSPPPGTALLLVGPEGGWSRQEVDLALARGTYLVRLGPRTLRAEAAPTVALTALWSAWGW